MFGCMRRSIRPVPCPEENEKVASEGIALCCHRHPTQNCRDQWLCLVNAASTRLSGGLVVNIDPAHWPDSNVLYVK